MKSTGGKYVLIYKTSIDTYSRMFQYKIVHDILPVNYKLYKWKVKDTDRCSYCFLERETIQHLFCECSYSVTLYCNIRDWAKKFKIILPMLNPVTILYGITTWKSENDLVNHIILIYKQILFYHRDRTRNNSNNLMPYFINKLNQSFQMNN